MIRKYSSIAAHVTKLHSAGRVWPGFVIIAAAALLLNLSAAAARAQAGSAPQSPPKTRLVIIAFKTHFDIGYTDLPGNVIERYRTKMIDQALEVCDQSRELPEQQKFVWTIPGWPMKKILEDWPGQTPERRQRIVQAFKEGRFVVHALPFTTHTETLEIEDLVRGMSFSTKLSRSMDLALPRDAKMTDVPCHSWILPTLLKNAGVNFLHLGCNSASSSPEVPMLFWWEGPDGSRLLTMYAAKGYGTDLVPPEDWPYGTWLALIHTGDNHGPPRPDEVKKLLDTAREKLPGVTVRVGRLSDFADAIIKENPDIPVVRGDMPDTWIHGPMSDPQGAKIARTIRPDIEAAEALGTELRAWGVETADTKDAIDEAYENSLLYGEHTWGGALRWITPYSKGRKFNYGDEWKKDRLDGKFKRIEQSWQEHTAYIEKARDLIEPVKQKQLEELSRAVNVAGKRIVVYNPLPWKRDGLVTVQLKGEPVKAVRPADGGETLPAETKAGKLRFVARDVPAMGYRSYVPAKASPEREQLAADAKTSTLESPFFKAVLDPARGAIVSLIEKSTGRELVDKSAPHGFGQYLYERFDANDTEGFVDAYIKNKTEWAVNEFGKPLLPSAKQAPYRAVTAGQFKAKYERNPFSVTATMEAPPQDIIKHPVTAKVTLYRNLPFVDVEIVLHEKPADPWPEAGWICLPLNVQEPRFHLGRLGSIIDPQKDVVRGSNRYIFTLNSGMAISDPQGWGVGLCPIDHPLVSLDVPGCWKYSKDFTPKRPYVYVNLFNNQWTTNFRLWNEGTWSSRVRLWTGARYEPQRSLVTPSQEARFALEAACFDGPAGNLPVSQRGVELSRKGVMVTSFGPDPEGKGTILRLWEQSGWSGPCDIRLPETVKTKNVQAVNLRGELQNNPVAAKGDTISINLNAFAPATILIGNQ